MHMHSAIDMIYPLILFGIILCFSDDAGSNALNIGVKSGSPGIIPCLYDKKHKENRKYWCKGSYWISCSILKYANQTGKYSLTDYPAQSIFTVQWKNLQTSDSGYYWCAVEIGGTLDDGYYLYLTVQSAPDVSVVNSSVSGHEGGDISVQCFYSSGYQNKVKQWCRYKKKSCYTVRRTNTSQNPSVQISDDGRRSFTVLMTGLRLTDSGWYYCSVGDLQVPVQIMVTKPKRAFTTTPADTPSPSEADMHTTQPSANRNPTRVNTIISTMATDLRPDTHKAETHPSLTAASVTVNAEIQDEQNKYLRHFSVHLLEIISLNYKQSFTRLTCYALNARIVLCDKYKCLSITYRRDVVLVMFLLLMLVLLLIVTLVAIVTWRMRKKPDRGQNREEEHFNSTAMSCENQMTSISPADATSPAAVDDSSVICSSGITFHKTPSSSVNSDGDVIYSSVKKTPKVLSS